jgi:hypothetical protein
VNRYIRIYLYIKGAMTEELHSHGHESWFFFVMMVMFNIPVKGCDDHVSGLFPCHAWLMSWKHPLQTVARQNQL